MVTVINTKPTGVHAASLDSYSTYKKPDTKIPPKAKPVLNKTSVNGVEITEADIMAEAQNHKADNPGDALFQAARALVIRELLWQEACTKDLDYKPILDENGHMETQKDAAIRALIDVEIDVPYATEEECRRFYQQNPHRCMSDTITQARHILIPAELRDQKARGVAQDQANNLIAILDEAPEKFGDLAKEFSACSSSQQGGNLGQLTRGSTVLEFEKALEHMSEGSISKSPVQTRFGFHIIALDRKEQGQLLPYEAVNIRLKAWLEAASWSKAVAQYITIVAGQAKITGISLDGADTPLVQ